MAYQQYSGVFTNTQAAQAKGQDKWVSTVVTEAGDDNFESTTLLLQANGSDGDTNNGFIDSSDNTHTITRNGNVTQGSFSPFSQDEGKWGNYLDGSTDYLDIASDASLGYGTGDFTIELWVWPDSSNTGPAIIEQRPASSNGSYFLMTINTSEQIGVYVNSSQRISASSSTALNANAWNHVAYVRSGGNSGVLYINGTSAGSWSDTTNYVTAGMFLGRHAFSSDRFKGYMSNVRVVKGTAVYTSAFTPPTESLTAITNTSLLTCQSNRFVDNSSNAHTITVNGNTKVVPFSPFPQTTAYDASTNGGSGYFDGNDRLFNSSGANVIDFGTGNFTVEMWVNLDTNTTVNQMLIEGPSDTGFQFYVQNDSGGTLYAGKSGVSVSVSYVLPSSFDNSWNHIAYVREGTGTNQATLYVNGVAVSTGTDSGNYTETGFQLSRASSYVINGYISNVRVVKGTAVYTSSFTPPTAPLTAVSGTSLLCNFTNASIFDATGKNVLETVGDAQVDTAVKKFGTGSMQFDGTGDNLAIPSNPNVWFGSGPFTIEMWLYPNDASSQQMLVSGSVSGSLFLGMNIDGGNRIALGRKGIAVDNQVSYTYSTGSWIHLACTRDSSNNVRFFVDGTQIGSTGSNSNTFSDSALNIAFEPTQKYLNGYIDDLRITKGVARYTDDFTPPTEEFKTNGAPGVTI